MTFEEAVAFALTLPDTERATAYGRPAVKVASNGRAFLFPGHESHESFALAIDKHTVEMLKDTGPETFYQTPHYVGYDAVLVRYDSPDPGRVREVIARARDWSAARPKTRPRSRPRRTKR